jgi:RNAse (barnase) inhibitor barstar
VAPFRQPDDSQRLDWRLLQCSPVTRYASRRILADDIAWLQEHGYIVHSFDCCGWTDWPEFHTQASEILHFPDYYGRNLNAFNDCLGDIPVPDAAGTALVFLAFDRFHRNTAGRAHAILDIIASNSRRFSLTGKRLLALVQCDDPSLVLGDVGASPVMMNPKEFGRRLS